MSLPPLRGRQASLAHTSSQRGCVHLHANACVHTDRALRVEEVFTEQTLLGPYYMPGTLLDVLNISRSTAQNSHPERQAVNCKQIIRKISQYVKK